jgi:hypothetical protein
MTSRGAQRPGSTRRRRCRRGRLAGGLGGRRAARTHGNALTSKTADNPAADRPPTASIVRRPPGTGRHLHPGRVTDAGRTHSGGLPVSHRPGVLGSSYRTHQMREKALGRVKDQVRPIRKDQVEPGSSGGRSGGHTLGSSLGHGRQTGLGTLATLGTERILSLDALWALSDPHSPRARISEQVRHLPGRTFNVLRQILRFISGAAH